MITHRKIKRKRYPKLAFLFEVDEQTKTLLRGTDDDKVIDHESSEDYDGDDEEMEDLEEGENQFFVEF